MGKNRDAGKPVFFSSYDKKHPAHKSANDKYLSRQARNAQAQYVDNQEAQPPAAVNDDVVATALMLNAVVMANRPRV